MITWEYLRTIATQRYRWTAEDATLAQELNHMEAVATWHNGGYLLNYSSGQLMPLGGTRRDCAQRIISARGIEPNGNTLELFSEECLVISEDITCVPLSILACRYRDAIDVNNAAAGSRRQKLQVPWLLKSSAADDGQRLLDALQAFHDGAVYVADSLVELDSLQVIDLDVKPLLDALKDDEENILASYMRELGYQTVSRDKKERLTVNETLVNNDTQASVLAYGIACRERLAQHLSASFRCLPLEAAADQMAVQS